MSFAGTSFEAFASAARGQTVATVEHTLWLDTETPVSLYLKSASGSTHSFLFESVEGGRALGRYSLIGVDPVATLAVRDGKTLLKVLQEKGRVCERAKRIVSTPVEEVRSIVEYFHCALTSARPRFAGGWVGHFSFDAIQYLERVPLGRLDPDPDQPEVFLALYTEGIVVDNVQRAVTIFSNALFEEQERSNADVRAAYDAAVQSIEAIVARLEGPLPRTDDAVRSAGPETRSSRDKSTYERGVERVKEYIAAGDAFQVVLSRRESVRSSRTPFSAYRSLRRINPSPYMYYVVYGDRVLIGSSPELLVRVENGVIQTRPIAGTRPRGADDLLEKEIETSLLSDEKEKAEHLMLVDLARNDLGRVCEPGTVRVSEFMTVEKFSHVMHMCSTVLGTLRKGISSLQGFFACFPAGTLSGAPKIRAMEIIAELEPERRGVYGGAVGYVDFSGNLDTCIAIRTIVYKNGEFTVQAGAGIVQDSVPENEFRETQNKMAALLEALNT